MFLIRSLRGKGTMVEVIQDGKLKSVEITSMGATKSERATDDMIAQKKWGYIDYKWEQPEKKEAPKVVEVSVEIEHPEEKTPEPVESPPEDPAEDESPEIEYYTDEEILSMKKSELLELVEEHPELGIEAAGLLKADLQELLLDFEIPKE